MNRFYIYRKNNEIQAARKNKRYLEWSSSLLSRTFNNYSPYLSYISYFLKYYCSENIFDRPSKLSYHTSMSEHQEEFKSHEIKPFKEQYGQNQEIYRLYKEKQGLQRSLVYEILNMVLKVYINIQNVPDDSLDSIQYVQCVAMLLKCKQPFLRLFCTILLLL